MYFESTCCSPESEAFETHDGAAETCLTVCEVGVCLKAVALLSDDCSDLAGVRAGFKGSCACIAASESCGECADAASRSDDFVCRAVNVSLLVKAMCAATDEEINHVMAAAFDD